MKQSDASQSESGAGEAAEGKRKLMYEAMHTPLGKYPETVTYTLGKIAGQIIRISRWEIRTKTMRIRDI